MSKVPEVRRYERSRDRNSRMLRSYVGKYLRRGIGAYLVDFEDALPYNNMRRRFLYASVH